MKRIIFLGLFILSTSCASSNMVTPEASPTSLSKSTDVVSPQETPSTEAESASAQPDLVSLPETSEPTSETVDTTPKVHCNMSDLMGTCEQRPKDDADELTQNCAGLGYEISEGPCPTENLFGTCEKEDFEPSFLYKPMFSTNEGAQNICAQFKFVPAPQ